MKCAECGKEIINAHYINGVAYGYKCYKQKIAVIYKQWEDEHNLEYSVKCFSAMEVFKDKKYNSFQQSVIKQWHDCKKLTAKQLESIIRGFSLAEKINFYCIWYSLSNEYLTKKSIVNWIELDIQKNLLFNKYMGNEAVNNALLYKYANGFHYWKDVDDDVISISDNGRDNKYLNEAENDEYKEILKVINEA